jgi:hypothetical protein
MKTKDGFILKLGIFSILIGIAMYFIEPVLPQKTQFPNHYFIHLFIIIITLLFHIGLINAGQKSDAAFIRFFMGATGAKLFLFMSIMLVYGLMNKAGAFGFILHFFVYYLFYTAFEVSVVYNKFSGMKARS